MTAIRDLSDEELSRWIAKKLGGITGSGYYIHPNMLYEPRHRDMVNDAAMTVMLLEKLLDGGKSYWLQKEDEGIMLQRVNVSVAVFRTTVGRAVAEEFALANGFDGEAQ